MDVWTNWSFLVHTGKARWSWQEANGVTTVINGSLIGTVDNDQNIEFILDFGHRGTYLHEAALHSNTRLSGRYVSATRSSINGTTSLQKEAS